MRDSENAVKNQKVQPSYLPLQKGFFGHPKGLSTLFFTEVWERFSYYGMRAILLFYMYDQIVHGGLGLSQGTAAAIMSVYGALVFMSGIIGGWLADRLLGTFHSILLGGVFIMLGHIALAIPAGVVALFISMVLIIVGTGLLKPNASNAVGHLYTQDDIRRDAGFSIYYMGINIGAFIAPYIVGTLGQKVNYHLGFGMAAIGMALGLIIFFLTAKKNLSEISFRPMNPVKNGEVKTLSLKFVSGAIVIALLLVVLQQMGILTIHFFVNCITIVAIIIPILYFIVMLTSKRTTNIEKSRIRAYIFLFIASVFFWIIDEQGSTTLAAFADQRTNLNAFGFMIPSSWFQSLNPICTVILAPTFAFIWIKMGHRQPKTPRKFAFGLIFAGLSFLILTLPSLLYGTDVKASPFWLVASYFLVIVGAMCLSPVGLSATTKLAPAAFSAQTMSLWLISDATAQGINAQIVPLFKPSTEFSYFGLVGGMIMILGIILFFFAPKIHQMMRGID
ncbi:peptide MFS transporter [Heyndrickxia coagulans]|uniref:peptide MFS transporter n=1 Tax=Heyndrickxia coagulans TaxID=1398 RepID=UPI0006288524|nr:peptide MFS transporter [Heyndrickxia coagulans]